MLPARTGQPTAEGGGRLPGPLEIASEFSLPMSTDHLSELLDQIAWLRHLLAAISATTYVLRVDRDRVVPLWVSDNISRNLGYAPAEALEPTFWLAGAHPEDRPAVAAAMEAVRQTGEFVAEYRFKRSDGEYRWLHDELRLVRTRAGEAETSFEAIGCWTDVTDRRRAQEALRDSEERFRALIENSTDILTVFDADGVIRFANPSLSRAIGRPLERIIGQSVFEFLHPEDRPGAERLFAGMRQMPDRTYRNSLRVSHEDGSWRIFDSIGRSLFHVPAIRGLVVNSRDITEQRRLEEQFHQAQRLESIGRLAGGVAHDFNNLLTVILGYAELLQGDASTRPPDATAVREIRRAADRARELTQQLLTVARKQVVEPRVLDLNQLVRSAERLLARLVGEDIELTTSLQGGLWPIKADPAQVEQVIMNLVVNARDAMPNGGRLRLETRNVTAPAGGGEARSGPYVRLTVTDSGAGIPPDVRRHLFEPFFTTKPEGKGTGLGLATVYGIVTQCGGAIDVESAPGRTSFRLYFPRSTDTVVATAPREAGTALGGPETILLVEDEPAVRELAATCLKRAGYAVLTAAKGQEALEIARSAPTPPAMLLTDVVMPGMSGKELAETLRKENRLLRVLFMSGYAEDQIAHHGVLEPGVELLGKPFTPNALLEKVRHVLDAK